MLVHFRNRRLEQSYRESKSAVRRLGPEVSRRFVERVNLMKSARDLDELLSLPGLHGHQLKGNRAGQYSIRLTGYIRLIFTLEGHNPPAVWIEELSKHYEE
jgi:proteic killer suppression protein